MNCPRCGANEWSLSKDLTPRIQIITCRNCGVVAGEFLVNNGLCEAHTPTFEDKPIPTKGPKRKRPPRLTINGKRHYVYCECNDKWDTSMKGKQQATSSLGKCPKCTFYPWYYPNGKKR